MIDFKVFIPSLRAEHLKETQLRLFKEQLVQIAPASLPPGISDGDLVEIQRKGCTEPVVLRVDASGEKPGWISLSYEAAGKLKVRGGETHSFAIRRIAADDTGAARSRYDQERSETAHKNDEELYRRLAEMASAVDGLHDKVERQFSHSVRHRDDTLKTAHSGAKWAAMGIAVSVVLFLIGWLVM